MRELHDGLGSRPFTSLSRVERGDMDAPQIAEALRDCIADMRLAIDALMPEDHDLRTALGNFLFRWQAVLEDAGVRPAWTIDAPDGAQGLRPQDVLQLLRIAQEALTNVLKHARHAGAREPVPARRRAAAGHRGRRPRSGPWPRPAAGGCATCRRARTSSAAPWTWR